MGEHTEIQWTDHTFNPLWGCTRVSEACQHCYAEAWAKRTGHDVWGKNADRRTFGDKHWNEPVRWNVKAERAGRPETVFCASMSDVFEDHPAWPPERERLWDLIGRTPWLTWQLLTKRPENIMGMVPKAWIDRWPANVWAGTTVENQRWAEERLPYLAQVPAPVRFASCEPLFDSLDLRPWLDFMDGGWGVNWVIAGGESGPKARPSDPAWFRFLREQCDEFGIPFLFKQWGEWLPMDGHREFMDLPPAQREWVKVGGDLADGGAVMVRVGKKVAGRTLDGRTWDRIPPLSVPTCP
jgi:protein gp37